MAQSVSSPDVPVAGGQPINTFDNPNFLGELFNISPRETPFLSLIGGIGGAATAAKDYTWQIEADEGDGDAAAVAAPGQPEGGDPDYSSVGRGEVSNVLQIFQYGLDITYSKLGAYNGLGGDIAPTAATDVVGTPMTIGGNNAIMNELSHQTSLKLAKMAKDVEKAFLNGAFVKPLTWAADQATPRKTQGIVGAVHADHVDLGGTADPVADIDLALLTMFGNSAPLSSTVIMANQVDMVKITAAYAAAGLTQPPRDRTTAGLAINSLVTNFGTFDIVVNRWLPAGTVLLVELSVCKTRVLPIPGKGTVFTEELAHTGATLKYQLYGELGLEYGPPQWHATVDASLWT